MISIKRFTIYHLNSGFIFAQALSNFLPINIGLLDCLCRDYDAFWNLNLIICGQSVLTVSFNNFNLIIYGQSVLITVSFDIFSSNDFCKLSEGSTIEFCWLTHSFISVFNLGCIMVFLAIDLVLTFLKFNSSATPNYKSNSATPPSQLVVSLSRTVQSLWWCLRTEQAKLQLYSPIVFTCGCCCCQHY